MCLILFHFLPAGNKQVTHFFLSLHVLQLGFLPFYLFFCGELQADTTATDGEAFYSIFYIVIIVKATTSQVM